MPQRFQFPVWLTCPSPTLPIYRRLPVRYPPETQPKHPQNYRVSGRTRFSFTMKNAYYIPWNHSTTHMRWDLFFNPKIRSEANFQVSKGSTTHAFHAISQKLVELLMVALCTLGFFEKRLTLHVLICDLRQFSWAWKISGTVEASLIWSRQKYNNILVCKQKWTNGQK